MSKVELYKKLIAQYYSGNLSKEDLATLVEGLQDEDLQTAWDQYSNEDDSDLSADADSQEKANALFDRIVADDRIKNQLIEQPKIEKPNYFYRNRIASAAIILFISVLSIFCWKKNTNTRTLTSTQPEIVNVMIKPGEARAQLILDDGKTIDLENLKGDTVITNGDFEIIKSKNGSISYRLKKGADSHDAKVAFNTIVTPKGGEYNLLLPDGTRVWLNAMTKIRYPVIFDKSIREIEMQGEAYFEVQKLLNHQQKVPFIIHTGSQSIEVLGTAFNLQNYDNTTISTTLIEGKVRLSFSDASQESQFLKPNEQAIFNSKSNSFTKKKVDPFYYKSWKEGKFAFDKTPIKEVMMILSRWYDVEFDLESNANDFQFSGTISKYDDLKKLLNTIELVGGIKFELKGRKVYVKN